MKVKKEEYVHKGALMEWVKEKLQEYAPRAFGNSDDASVRWGQRNAFQQMLDKLNSM